MIYFWIYFIFFGRWLFTILATPMQRQLPALALKQQLSRFSLHVFNTSPLTAGEEGKYLSLRRAAQITPLPLTLSLWAGSQSMQRSAKGTEAGFTFSGEAMA